MGVECRSITLWRCRESGDRPDSYFPDVWLFWVFLFKFLIFGLFRFPPSVQIYDAVDVFLFWVEMPNICYRGRVWISALWFPTDRSGVTSCFISWLLCFLTPLTVCHCSRSRWRWNFAVDSRYIYWSLGDIMNKLLVFRRCFVGKLDVGNFASTKRLTMWD